VRRTDRLVGNLERQQRRFDEAAAKASRAGRTDEAAAARAEASLHGRLARQEKAYRDRVVEIGQGAKLAAEIAGFEATPPASLSKQRPPLHRRILNGIKRLFSSHPPAHQREVERARHLAFHRETLHYTGVQHMWGFFGAMPSGRARR
jgi:hypothetical protein